MSRQDDLEACFASELDGAALAGWDSASANLDFDRLPTTVHIRSDPDAIDRAVFADSGDYDVQAQVHSQPSCGPLPHETGQSQVRHFNTVVEQNRE